MLLSISCDVSTLIRCCTMKSPLCSIHTMISPLSSLVVSFRNCGFHVTHTTAPVCPSSVWFMDRFDEAAIPFDQTIIHNSSMLAASFMRYDTSTCSRASGPAGVSSFRTLSSPASPPHAIHPYRSDPRIKMVKQGLEGSADTIEDRSSKPALCSRICSSASRYWECWSIVHIDFGCLYICMHG